MTIIQESKQKMGDAVSTEFNTFNSVWSPNPIFTANVGKHINNMGNISNYQQKQAAALEIKGITQHKKLIRTLLTEDTLTLIFAIKALAAETDNVELAQSVNYSKGILDSMSQSDFLAACNQVKAVATANAAALVPHGITAPMQTSYAADVASFATISPKTRAGISEGKMYTTKLKEAVNEMVTHLKTKVDLNIEQYKNTEFYLAYKSARKVISHSNGTGLRGTISNANTEMVLRGIQIEIVELNRKTFTNSKGHYSFKKLPDGIYTIRMRGEGYITTEMPDVELKKGALKDMDFTIEPNLIPVPVPVQ